MRGLYNFVQKIIFYCRYWNAHFVFQKRYRRVLHTHGYKNHPSPGEAEWIRKWRQLDPHISSLQYRVFSHYIGSNINIIPEEASHFFIEPLLNSSATSPYYSDKNMFDKVLPNHYLPTTFLRRINGVFYNRDYQIVTLDNVYFESLLNSISDRSIVIKPSVGGESGIGVRIFQKSGQNWVNLTSPTEKLNIDLLTDQLGLNYIMQAGIEQHEYISRFNYTSVNTLRLAVYRSVKDNTCHILGAILRIGKAGSMVDNAHSGGFFVGINGDGTLCHKLCNQWGETITHFNGIDFSQNFIYPNWTQVVEFAKNVGQHIIHHRLLALDIALDKSGTPILIEYNIMPGTFSTWLFQYTVGPAYGKYSDEILDYCLSINNKFIDKSDN